MSSVGGAIAAGLQGGWQMGQEASAAAERRREFDAEQAARDAAQARLAKQEEDRYGRMNDQARIQAVEQRLTTLRRLSDAAVAAGHQPADSVLQEQAQLMVQMDDMQQQIQSTGRLAPPGVSAAIATPRANVAAADMTPAPAPPPMPATGVAAALGGMPPAQPGTPPAQPGTPPAQPGTPPAQPGTPPAQPGTPPAQPGTPPAQPGTPPAQPGTPPAQPGTPPAQTDNGPVTAAATAGGTAPVSDMPGAAPPVAAVSSPTTSAVTPAQQVIANVDQRSQDLASRLQSGQMSLSDVKPGDFALMVASATKRPPGELDQVRQHIADWQSGMATQNDGLTLQGLNGIFGPQINQGVGSPSPHGGIITGKSVIGLDPAMSADGVVHADKVIPRLRVTTDVVGANGQPLSYDAPMTQNRSSDPNDPVTAIPMADAVSHIGALGGLVEAASHPDAQALIAKGAADPRVAQYLEAIKQGAQPADPVAARQAIVDKYSKLWGTDSDDTVSRLVQLGYLKPVPQTKGTVAQTMEAAQQLVDGGTAPDLNSALKMLQAGGVSKQPSKYSPGAANAGGGAPSTPSAPAPGATPGDATLTGDDYLKTLPPDMRATVVNVASNPDLLKNVPMKQRSAVANAVLRYKPDSALGTAGGTAGSRESIYTSRVLTSMHEAVADAKNVMELPLSSSTGFLGLSSPKTLLTAGRNYLMNKVSDDDIQGYNVLSAGFQRSLATIETSGLAPGQNFTDSLAKLQLQPGDTELTKMRKMAQTRQIVEAGLQPVLANPRVPAAQKKEAQDALDELKTVIPFTQHDLTTLQAKWNDSPNTAMGDIIKKHPIPPASPPAAPVAGIAHAAAPAPAIPSGWSVVQH